MNTHLKILMSLFLWLNASIGAAQSLVLIKQKTGENVVIKEGARIRFWDINGRSSKGSFQFISPNQIFISEVPFQGVTLSVRDLDSAQLSGIFTHGISINDEAFSSEELLLYHDSVLIPKKYIYNLNEFHALRDLSPSAKRTNLMMTAVGFGLGFISFGLLNEELFGHLIIPVVATCIVMAIILDQPKKLKSRSWIISTKFPED